MEIENEPADAEMETEVEEASDDDLQIVDDIRNCIICKDLGEKSITANTAPKLAKQLKLFHDDGLLNFDLQSRLPSKGEEYLARRLETGSFKIHKSCYDKFNESKRNCAKSAQSTDDEPTIVTRSQCPTPVSFGEELCMHCGAPEFVDPKNKKNNVPLHAAARKKIKAGYVDELTNNLRTMAGKLGDTKLLTLLLDDA